MFEILYIILILLLAVLVGEGCFKYGKYFLRYCGLEKQTGIILNQMLRIGFYLLTIGAGFINMIHLPYNYMVSDGIDILMSRIGNLMLIWGLMHIVNLIVLVYYKFLKLSGLLQPGLLKLTIGKISVFVSPLLVLYLLSFFDQFIFFGDMLIILLFIHFRIFLPETDDLKQYKYALGWILIIAHAITFQLYHEFYFFFEILFISILTAEYLIKINKNININLALKRTKTTDYE